MQLFNILECKDYNYSFFGMSVAIPNQWNGIDIYRGYYMAARRYEISLLVLKNISRVSEANE